MDLSPRNCCFPFLLSFPVFFLPSLFLFLLYFFKLKIRKTRQFWTFTFLRLQNHLECSAPNLFCSALCSPKRNSYSHPLWKHWFLLIFFFFSTISFVHSWALLLTILQYCSDISFPSCVAIREASALAVWIVETCNHLTVRGCWWLAGGLKMEKVWESQLGR